MKYKVGDKVLMEMVVDEIRNNDYAPIWVSLEREDTTDGMWLKEEQIDKYAYKGASKTYEDGLADAWRLARKICGDGEDTIDGCTLGNIFEFGNTCHIMNNNTYQEALAKIEAYEESKAIKVGDVVERISLTGTYIVTRVTDDHASIMDGYGFMEETYLDRLKKTGRHIDITSILEQIRGNE